MVFRFLLLALTLAVAHGQGCLDTATCAIGATEGPVLSISPMDVSETALGESGVKVSVMGVSVLIPESSFTSGGIASGSGVILTSADLLGTDPLPGRPNLAGFLMSTAKCEVADVDIDGAITGLVGAMIGRSCIIEAAENVMLATVTNKIDNGNGDCQLFIGDNGLELVPNEDARYAFGGASDTEGFSIDYCSIPVGAAVGAEGYYGVDETPVNRFHIFAIESSAGTRIGGAGLTTISRVRCEDGGRLEIRGSVTNPLVVTVTISDADTGVVIGDTDVDVFDPVVNAAVFRFREDVDVCPDSVTATADDGSSFTE